MSALKGISDMTRYLLLTQSGLDFFAPILLFWGPSEAMPLEEDAEIAAKISLLVE
jgi:hypothetical protein